MKRLKCVWIFEMIIIIFPLNRPSTSCWINQTQVHLEIYAQPHCLLHILHYSFGPSKKFNKHLLNNMYQILENTQMYLKIHMKNAT